MKKYLLLATTALLATNVANAGTVGPGGQSATIGASVEIGLAPQITGVTDMDFGQLNLTEECKDANKCLIATITGGEVVTTPDWVIPKGTVHAAEISGIGNTYFDDTHTFTYSCPTGKGNLTDGCHLNLDPSDPSVGYTLYLKDFNVVGHGSGTTLIGAKLYVPKDFSGQIGDGTYTGSFLVTLNY